MPLHLARSLGKRVEEIEVVRDGAREVQVAHLKKPVSDEDLRRAQHVLEADSEIAGIVLRAGTVAQPSAIQPFQLNSNRDSRSTRTPISSARLIARRIRSWLRS